MQLVFTSVKTSVPEVWVKVRCTRGPCIVQSTVTLPRPGAVLNTNKESLSPIIRNIIKSVQEHSALHNKSVWSLYMTSFNVQINEFKYYK